jgi:hypothetical protein
VTPQDRRLAALAAALAPGSAGPLLRLLSSPDAPRAQAHAEALSRCSRVERLAALAAALSEGAVERQISLRTAAAAERPRIARKLVALAQPQMPDATCRPALARVLIERGRSS